MGDLKRPTALPIRASHRDLSPACAHADDAPTEEPLDYVPRAELILDEDIGAEVGGAPVEPPTRTGRQRFRPMRTMMVPRLTRRRRLGRGLG